MEKLYTWTCDREFEFRRDMLLTCINRLNELISGDDTIPEHEKDRVFSDAVTLLLLKNSTLVDSYDNGLVAEQIDNPKALRHITELIKKLAVVWREAYQAKDADKYELAN